MNRIYLIKNAKGEYVVDNDDGTGIKGRSLGKQVEDLGGGAVGIKDCNDMGHIAVPVEGGRFMTILNEMEIKSYKSET